MTTVLIIGRFQPFHLGHLKLIEKFAKNHPNLVIGIGSSQEKNTRENPFSASERKEMIVKSLKIPKKKYTIVDIPDVNDDKKWVSWVVSLTPKFDVVGTNAKFERGLFEKAGFKVEETRLFNRDEYSGTRIRDRILNGGEWKNLVPAGTAAVMEKINAAERIRKLYKT